MKVASSGQMNEIDKRTINEIGIPGMVLMENASLKVAEEALKSLGNATGRTVYIFAGKGNNGGDAFAVARHLFNRGADTRVFIPANKKDIKNDAAVNLDILERMKVEVLELTDHSQLPPLKAGLKDADLIIDGILGTGFKGKISGILEKVIEIVNSAGKPVISIDIPSGVNGDTGETPGICVKADKTVTFALPKTGLVVHPGCEFTGELVVEDISIPKSVVEGMDIKLNLTDLGFVSRLIPERRSESNKGDYGKILIISGSEGMTGSGCLAASAALRSGAGLVYLGVPASLSAVYNSSLVEAIVIPLEDNKTGFVSRDSMGKILEKMGGMDAVAVGPGLSTREDIFYIVSGIIENSKVPLLLDADALNAISKDVSVLGMLKAEAVLTPHPGEMARLCGISIKDVQNNRIRIAREFADKWGVTVVLKGARTVIAYPDGSTYINPTGNPGMASAGMGDVLTGVITSLVGQGLKPCDAATAGVYIHGAAGDSAASKIGVHGLIASDLVKELSYSILKIRHG